MTVRGNLPSLEMMLQELLLQDKNDKIRIKIKTKVWVLPNISRDNPQLILQLLDQMPHKFKET